ncbi:MAG: putative quinol monooxygenase [Pseudomonadota bacterium]
MIVVNVEVKLGAGGIDAVKDAIAEMEAETRKEDGCLTYAFSLDVTDPGLMRITEWWASEDHLKAHFGQPHMASFGAALGAIEVLSMEARAFETGSEVALPI